MTTTRLTNNNRRNRRAVPRRSFAEPLECRVLLSTFNDDFEAPTLDPFWNRVIQDGATITLSIAQAHSGLQSAQFAMNPYNGTNESAWLALQRTMKPQVQR